MKVVAFLIFSVMFIVLSVSAQDLSPIEDLGKQIYFEKISSPDWMSCATCHAPEVGFVGPIPAINTKTAVYNGAVPQRFGNRKPPSASYATFSPVFDYDKVEGLFYGGNFWDGRATGWRIGTSDEGGNPTAEQAIGPFLNPVEHNMPSKEAVLMEIENAKMGDLWEEVFGEKLSYAEVDIDKNYDRVGVAIAAYEGSKEVNPFSSKYDYYLEDAIEFPLTDQEMWGLDLFNDVERGNCAACHPSDPTDEGPPLFTDFTFDNLGIPANPANPFYEMNEVYLDNGEPINPMGVIWVDNGLGDFLRGLADDRPEGWRSYAYVPENMTALTEGYLRSIAPSNDGKHKVPSLRNVGKRPSKNYVKAYGHNGYFKSLEEITHFYNTSNDSVTYWPDPEVSANVNTDELGNLGLSLDEEAAIVAFMNTLSDGYDPSKDKVKDKLVLKSATLEITGANPFNPSTTLSYMISQNSTIKIEIYNVIGQRVATLIDGQQPAGTHMVRWDASMMSSGTYFVRMEAKNNIITRKLLLVK